MKAQFGLEGNGIGQPPFQTTFKEIREKIKFYATSDNLQSSRI